MTHPFNAPVRPSGPPYKAPNRKWFTEALFWESNLDRTSYLPVFSLYQDQPNLVNCRKTFLELRDPTGYTWAIKYLSEYAHFKVLMKLDWFKAALDAWKDELDVLLQAEALQKIQETAKGASQSAYQAAKFLAQREHRKVSSRGRPSTEEVKGELRRQATEAQETTDDYHRVFGAPSPATLEKVN